MKLADIQALRPPAAAPAATIAAALATARSERQEQATRQAAAEGIRADVLGSDDKSLFAAERDAATARLVVDRLDALLPQLQADHLAAQGRETLAELRAEAAGLDTLAGAVRRWQVETYPALALGIGEGLHAQQKIADALAGFSQRVDLAYERQEVRDAGPLGITLPVLDGPEPRALFPYWLHGAPA